MKIEQKLIEFYKQRKPAGDYMSIMNLFSYEMLDLGKAEEEVDFNELIYSEPEIPEDPFEFS